MTSRSRIRIGTEKPVNETELNTIAAFNLLFDGFHEFVHTPVDDGSWLPVDDAVAASNSRTINILN
jgi:hypothetical protein